MKLSHVAVAAVFAAATTLAACGSDEHSLSASDANKPASAESAASAHDERVSPANTTSQAVMKPMTYRELVKTISLDCEDADTGRGCTMQNAHSEDKFTVTLHPDCGKEGIFVVVDDSEETVKLWGTPPGVEARATLSGGQVVCIQATAYIEGEITPFYYYVTTVPVEMLENCLSTSACKKRGDPPITWHVPHPGPPCRATGSWSYEGTCAAGWVRAEDIGGYLDPKSTTNNMRKESDQ